VEACEETHVRAAELMLEWKMVAAAAAAVAAKATGRHFLTVVVMYLERIVSESASCWIAVVVGAMMIAIEGIEPVASSLFCFQ